MQRIDVAERRARLVSRHRLDPAARARDPLEVARSLVCLHATDAVTVFLAVQARSDGVAPADVETALYDDRSVVRLLAMRRTLWAVPRELAAGRLRGGDEGGRGDASGSGSRASSATAASPPARVPGSRVRATRQSQRWPRGARR